MVFFIYIYAAVLLYLCRAARVFVFENAWARMYFTCMSARIRCMYAQRRQCVCERERKGENLNFYLYAELATKAISQ